MTPDTILFATEVLLAEGGEQGGSPLGAFLPLILIIGIFWFLIMRPQQKRAREHKQLIGEVKQGDKVVAAGGIVGTVRRVDDELLTLQVADGVSITVDRGSVAKRLTEA